MRPPETVQLVADPSKARRQLGWQPSLSFKDLVRLMISTEYDNLK